MHAFGSALASEHDGPRDGFLKTSRRPLQHARRWRDEVGRRFPFRSSRLDPARCAPSRAARAFQKRTLRLPAQRARCWRDGVGRRILVRSCAMRPPERHTRRIEPGPQGPQASSPRMQHSCSPTKLPRLQSHTLFATTNAAVTTMNAALVVVSEVPHPEEYSMLSNL